MLIYHKDADNSFGNRLFILWAGEQLTKKQIKRKYKAEYMVFF